MSRKIVLSAAAQAVQAQEICQPVGAQPANPHVAGCDLAGVIAAEGWQVTS